MATYASHDENGVPTLLGTVNTGVSTIAIKGIPSEHALSVSDGTSGSDNGPVNAPRDINRIPALMAISSADGITPIPIYTTIQGKLLIKST